MKFHFFLRKFQVIMLLFYSGHIKHTMLQETKTQPLAQTESKSSVSISDSELL